MKKETKTKRTERRTKMETINISDLIEIPKRGLPPGPHISRARCHQANDFSDRVNKEQIVSNFTVIPRSLRCMPHYTVRQVC